jgi:hypothetical protein
MKIPLLPSLLYAIGDTKVNQEVEDELERGDPPSSAGAAAIEKSKISETPNDVHTPKL